MDVDKTLNLAAIVIDVASAYVLIHRIAVRVKAMRPSRHESPSSLRLVS